MGPLSSQTRKKSANPSACSRLGKSHRNTSSYSVLRAIKGRTSEAKVSFLGCPWLWGTSIKEAQARADIMNPAGAMRLTCFTLFSLYWTIRSSQFRGVTQFRSHMSSECALTWD